MYLVSRPMTAGDMEPNVIDGLLEVCKYSKPFKLWCIHFFLSFQLSSLCQRLDELWEENQGFEVLFTWIQFLKEDTLGFLSIQSPLEINRSSSKGASERRKTEPEAKGIFFFCVFRLYQGSTTCGSMGLSGASTMSLNKLG